MLQRLERADRHAELLARLQVLERRVVGVADRADRFRADERGREIDHRLDQRQPVAGVPDERIVGDANAVEHDVRGAHPVERAVAAHGDPGRLAIDEEDADAVGVGDLARRARRHDQHVGVLAVDDDALLAVEHIAAVASASRASRCGRGRSAQSVSSCAKASVRSPATTAGRIRCFCAAVPARATNCAPRPTVGR